MEIKRIRTDKSAREFMKGGKFIASQANHGSGILTQTMIDSVVHAMKSWHDQTPDIVYVLMGKRSKIVAARVK